MSSPYDSHGRSDVAPGVLGATPNRPDGQVPTQVPTEPPGQAAGQPSYAPSVTSAAQLDGRGGGYVEPRAVAVTHARAVPPEVEASKGPMRKRFDGYLAHVEETIVSLMEAEQTWFETASLLELAADDLGREREKLPLAMGAGSEVTRVAEDAFDQSALELRTKAAMLKNASRSFGTVRQQLDEARVARDEMDGQAASTPHPGPEPKLSGNPEKHAAERKQLQEWRQKHSTYQRMAGDNEQRASQQMNKLDVTYRDAAQAMRAFHTDETSQASNPSSTGPSVPHAAASGVSAAGAGGAGIGVAGALGAGVLGAGALGAVRAINSSLASARALPTTGGSLGASARAGGPGTLGGARSGGMPMNRGGAGGAGGRSSDRKRRGAGEKWDDGEDWIDDEDAGPDVIS